MFSFQVFGNISIGVSDSWRVSSENTYFLTYRYKNGGNIGGGLFIIEPGDIITAQGSESGASDDTNVFNSGTFKYSITEYV